MARTCTVCKHADREPIERALLVGKSYRNIAARFGTSTSALVRHKADHLSSGMLKAHDAVEVARADTLLEDVRHGEGRADRLYNAAEDILSRALEAKDLRTALNAIKAANGVMGEARQYLELRGDLTGELNGRNPAFPEGQIILMSLPKSVPSRPPMLTGKTTAS